MAITYVTMKKRSRKPGNFVCNNEEAK